MNTQELIQEAHEHGLTPQDIDDIHFQRLQEVAERLQDGNRSFSTFLADVLAVVPAYMQERPDGPGEAKYDDRATVTTVGEAVAAMELEIDPELTREPHKRHSLVIQQLERTIKRASPSEVLHKICYLGLLAASYKPEEADIPQDLKDAALDRSKPIRASRHESAPYKVFRYAVTALRQQTKYELTEAEQEIEIAVPGPPQEVIAQYGPLLNDPNTAATAASVMNKRFSSRLALRVLQRLLRPDVTARDVHDELFVTAQARMIKAEMEAAATAQAEPGPKRRVRIEPVPYAMLQPGTLRDWRRDYQPPEPHEGEESVKHIGRVVATERLDLILELYDALGPDARLAARPLNVTPPSVSTIEKPIEQSADQAAAAAEPHVEERTFDPAEFDLSDYILVVWQAPLPEHLRTGDAEASGESPQMIEHAVGICAMTKNIIIVWRGENGVVDGRVTTDWRHVFQYNKPNVYLNFPVRRLQFTSTAKERILQAFSMPIDDFNAELDRIAHRRLSAAAQRRAQADAGETPKR